jgi:hypothetical protein
MKLTKAEQLLVDNIAKFIVIILAIIFYFLRLIVKLLYRLKKWLFKFLIIFLVIRGSLAVLTPIVYAPKAEAQYTQFLTSKQDQYIYTYATRFQRPDKGKPTSFLRYQLACLAFKENGYHSDNKCGDSGLACGMYQYHQSTYLAFRNEMIKEGLTDHIGSRLNDQDATETTAWAVTHGHENDWGPLNLGMCY